MKRELLRPRTKTSMKKVLASECPETPAVSLEVASENGSGVRLIFRGSLQASTIHQVWQEAIRHLEAGEAKASVQIDASAVRYCDVAGIGMLLDLELRQKKRGGTVVLVGLDSRFQRLWDQFADCSFAEVRLAKAACPSLPEATGGAIVNLARDVVVLCSFVGELTVAFGWGLWHPKRLRWRDVFLTAANAGANALPIVGLISFLIGLIIAFQSAIPLEQFGARSFVADLVAVSLVRELGPLMTAILLAGRSGAAFAAEIGTMKVNEEINALRTMGLQPVRFLVVARVIATVAIMPVLTIFSLIFGLIGGGIVYVSLGFTTILYGYQVVAAVDLSDFLGGLFKAAVFGLLVAAVGCFRGLQTEIGARAVGVSTTRAVVSGITLIVIADGVFSVVFYLFGI